MINELYLCVECGKKIDIYDHIDFDGMCIDCHEFREKANFEQTREKDN